MNWTDHGEYKYRREDNLWTSQDFEPVDESEILRENFELYGNSEIKIGFRGRRIRKFFVQMSDGRLRVTFTGNGQIFCPEIPDSIGDAVRRVLVSCCPECDRPEAVRQVFPFEVMKGEVMEEKGNEKIWAKDEKTFKKRGGEVPEVSDHKERAYYRFRDRQDYVQDNDLFTFLP